MNTQSFVLSVTSVVGGAGRSTISRGLAASLARVGHRVAWVGADLGEGPLREGVDIGLRAAFAANTSTTSIGPLQRVGALDDADVQYALHADPDFWSSVLGKLRARAEIVVIDAPRSALAEPLITASTHVLALMPLDRPPPFIEPLALVVRRARAQSGTVLLGLVPTRFDPLRRGATRALEEVLAVAPAEAWLRPLIPEGAGAARDGAIDELGRRFCESVGLRDPKPRSVSQIPGAFDDLRAEAS